MPALNLQPKLFVMRNQSTQQVPLRFSFHTCRKTTSTFFVLSNWYLSTMMPIFSKTQSLSDSPTELIPATNKGKLKHTESGVSINSSKQFNACRRSTWISGTIGGSRLSDCFMYRRIIIWYKANMVKWFSMLSCLASIW